MKVLKGFVLKTKTKKRKMKGSACLYIHKKEGRGTNEGQGLIRNITQMIKTLKGKCPEQQLFLSL